MNRLSTSQPGKFIQVPLLIFSIPHSRKTTVPRRKFPFISCVPQTLSPLSGNEHKKRVEDTSENVSSTPMKLAASEFIETRV